MNEAERMWKTRTQRRVYVFFSGSDDVRRCRYMSYCCRLVEDTILGSIFVTMTDHHYHLLIRPSLRHFFIIVGIITAAIPDSGSDAAPAAALVDDDDDEAVCHLRLCDL
ncbi:hypothetical protein D9757_011201 [Collybiopsis confluens]|uniref:Uncharacterized protein n=1 Tax=Collybiopsis confluens TaxID=2823264 RepID=A0A8H5H2W9_9AGAR|nr:hypothetical protein D9757_011201 [Collybiopsis confluens]